MCFLAYVVPTKTCHKCKVPQVWEAFNNDKRTPDGMLNLCRECLSLKQKASYARNQKTRAAAKRQSRVTDGDTVRAQARARYAANPEYYRAQGRAEHERNPEKLRARGRAKHAKNRTKDNLAQRQRYAAHPEKWVEWRANNLPTMRLIDARRRARLRNLPDTFTLGERQFMLDYWHHACAICGNEEGLWWMLVDDHWAPISSPDCPGTVATNMIPLCHAKKGATRVEGTGGCNNSKNDSAPEAWLASRYTPVQVKRILKAIHAYFAAVKARQAQEVAS